MDGQLNLFVVVHPRAVVAGIGEYLHLVSTIIK
jgi:hypothetical protein